MLSGSNEFVIKTGSNGLTIKSNGSAVLSGSLTRNPGASLKGNVEDADLTDCTDMLENINVKTYTSLHVQHVNMYEYSC